MSNPWIVSETSSLRERSQSAYEGARYGRRLQTWRPTPEGPNSINTNNLTSLRNRSRDMARNNPWIASAQNNWVADEIGTGITGRSAAPDKAFRAAANDLWKDFVKECDADGITNFAGILAMMVRGRREAGEIFLRFRDRRPSDGLTVPLQLQVLESEFCPMEDTDLSRRIKHGVKFDTIGRRTHYRMYRNHPGEFDGDRFDQLADIPADQIIHHFTPLRAGQIRGIPATVQALIKAKDFDEYDDAELNRKKTRSSYTGVFTRPDYGEEDYKFDPFTGEPLEEFDDAPVTDVQPGTWMTALPGESATLFDGDKAGDGYADFIRAQLLAIAASLGVPYEIMTGDMSAINDRTLRAILNQYRRLLEHTQWLYTIPQICERVWSAFIDRAVLAGKLYAPDYLENRKKYQSSEWRPDGWDYLHPVQDVQSKILQKKAGLKSRSAIVAEQGEDAEEVDRQNAEDSAREKDLGLNYETDTSATSNGSGKDKSEE